MNETAVEAEVVGTSAIVPVMGTGLVFQGADALRKRLADYADERKVFVEWLRGNLVPGVDYQLIHRKLGAKGSKYDCPNDADKTSMRCEKCGAKAALSKAGAEKICSLLQLKPVFARDTETWEMLGSPAGTICLMCSLLNSRGEIVGEGRGARTVQADFGDVNKTVKMVEKSAQIDGTMRVACVSELFTQDAEPEKDDEDEKPPKAPTAPPPAATKIKENAARPPEPMSAEPIGALMVRGVFPPEEGRNGNMKPWKVTFTDGSRAAIVGHGKEGNEAMARLAQECRNGNIPVVIEIEPNENPKFEGRLKMLAKATAGAPAQATGQWDKTRFMRLANRLAFSAWPSELGDSEFQAFMAKRGYTTLADVKTNDEANAVIEALKAKVAEAEAEAAGGGDWNDSDEP